MFGGISSVTYSTVEIASSLRSSQRHPKRVIASKAKQSHLLSVRDRICATEHLVLSCANTVSHSVELRAPQGLTKSSPGWQPVGTGPPIFEELTLEG